MIEFDLSSIDDWSITVDSATLEVYESQVGDTGVNYGTYRITSSWNENSVIWNTRPSWGGTSYDNVIADGATGWWEFDITNLVAGWIDDSYENYGVAITYPAGGCSPSQVCASEYASVDPDLCPKLTIEYTVTAVEEKSWGFIKADF
ncbi:MAG: DNRLRE domain-containing protein [Candidatus Coatesbacteria bacterium]|nr:DNRLRE domain-containing protein [Candidatus Coatesbacteria bacterium]